MSKNLKDAILFLSILGGTGLYIFYLKDKIAVWKDQAIKDEIDKNLKKITSGEVQLKVDYGTKSDGILCFVPPCDKIAN